MSQTTLPRDYLQEMKQVISILEEDYDKAFNKKNKSANIRLRKNMLKLRDLLQETRTASREMTKN